MLGTMACIGVPVDPAGAHHAYRLTGVVPYPPAANGDLSGAHRRAAFRLAGSRRQTLPARLRVEHIRSAVDASIVVATCTTAFSND
jgi:hypothetical protein